MDKKKTTLLAISGVVALIVLVVLVSMLARGGGSDNNSETPGVLRNDDGTIILLMDDSAEKPAEETAGETEPAETDPAEKEPEETPASPGAKQTQEDDAARTPAPTPAADPDVPARTQEASPDYFADAAFVGDETVAALERYDYDGLLTEAVFYEVTTVTNSNYVKLLERDGGYGKVYIGFGGAELANKMDDVRKSVSTAIDSIRANNPDCLIYLMSFSPVSKYRTDVSSALRMDRALEYNDMLRDLAAEKGVWYIEITSALVDEEGYLPSDVTEDGINYTPGHYQGWYDRLAIHYIGDTE